MDYVNVSIKIFISIDTDTDIIITDTDIIIDIIIDTETDIIIIIIIIIFNNLFIIELTVGHESNTVANATRKAKKYEHLLNDSDLKRSHRKICFVNLVMTAIGIYSKHSEEFFKMLKDLNIDNTAATYISTKLTEICIRSSYYIFCMRTKEWTEQDLMNF